jgi:fructose-1-phosphate kinase PfkB-like protein
MIFTVTFNPSLDRTLSIPELHPGAIHRVDNGRIQPDGRQLGQESQVNQGTGG